MLAEAGQIPAEVEGEEGIFSDLRARLYMTVDEAKAAYNAAPEGANLYNKAGLPATPFAQIDGKFIFEEDNPAIAAALTVWFTGWTYADPLLALVIAVLWHREWDEPLDGIVYASFIALGYAAVENYQAFLDRWSGDGPLPADARQRLD